MKDTLTIRLDENLSQALEAEARQTGLSKGEIARDALKSRLQSKANRSPFERYIGIMRGPSDLSWNKSYRRSWNKKKR